MSEIWDAYDRQFNKIENIKLIRGEVIPNGMYHLVCEIILKHTDGKFLLMRRALEKNHGGMWELTAGGSVLADETPIECAMRELYEETGIAAFNFQEIKRIVHDEHQSLYVEFLCNTKKKAHIISL